MSKLRSKFALLVLLRTQLMSRVIERSSYNCSGCSNSRFFCVKTYSINNLAGYEKRILCFETRKDVNDIKVEVHDNCLSVSLMNKNERSAVIITMLNLYTDQWGWDKNCTNDLCRKNRNIQELKR